MSAFEWWDMQSHLPADMKVRFRGGCFGCEGEGRQVIAKKLFVHLGKNIIGSTVQYSNHFFLSCFHLGLLTSI